MFSSVEQALKLTIGFSFAVCRHYYYYYYYIFACQGFYVRSHLNSFVMVVAVPAQYKPPILRETVLLSRLKCGVWL